MVSFLNPVHASFPPPRLVNVDGMCTSKADVFRTRQTLRDLTEAVRINKDAVLCLGTTGAEKDAISRIIDLGCKIELPQDDRVYARLLLMAAMPEDDFPAFISATLILLTDRLQSGGGTDDLYWNWEAFSDHYRLADPPVRAALMNGFRLAHHMGRLNLGDDLRDADCLTQTEEDVLSMIEGEDPFGLVEAIENGVTASDAGAIWEGAAGGPMTWQTLAGFRYLYERVESMSGDAPKDMPLIPWA